MNTADEKGSLMNQRCVLYSKMSRTLGQKEVLKAIHPKELIPFVIDSREGQLYIQITF